MILSDLHKKITEKFKLSGFESSDLESKFIITHALGISPTQFSLNKNMEINEASVQKVELLTEKRLTGEPLAYVLGDQEFYGITFKVRSGVLVPRQETERLVECAIDWLKFEKIEYPQVADLGCGSGCIGISVISQVGGHLTAFDKSGVAAEVTKENVDLHGLSDQSTVLCTDVSSITENFYNKFDIVVSNPPYIADSDPEVQESVKKYEPSMALFSGPKGLECIEAWSYQAAMMLKPKGLCLFEIGYKQGEAAKKIFLNHSLFESIEILRDYEDRERIIKAVRNNNGSSSHSGRS